MPRSRSRSRSKSKVRIPISGKNTLGKYGYHDVKNMSALARHRALQAAVRAKGSLEVIRRLNALATLQKNTHPTLSKKIRADQTYVSKMSKSRSRSRSRK